jgi:hypothetical protein
MRLLYVLLSCLLGVGWLSAQNPRSIELQGDYGFLILHSQDIRPIGQSYPFGVGIDYSYWLLKEKNWKNCQCYPRVGLSLNYQNFDNSDVLGWGIPLYGFVEPWYRIRNNLFFTIRAGAGYSWLSNPYDAETNPLNLSYSLHLTPFIMVGTGLSYSFNPQWQAGVQFRYNHVSNGGMQEPNKGLNYPTGSVSLSYSWEGVEFPKRRKVPLSELSMRKSLVISAFAAGKSIDATRVTYTVPGLEIKYSQQVGRISALVGGVEWISNLAYRERIRQIQSGEDHNQLALLFGHEFLLGNFTFSQLAGVYVYKDYDVKPDWYQRYGLVWYPFDQFFLGTQIKVHGHVAEFLDFRIGYRLSL